MNLIAMHRAVRKTWVSNLNRRYLRKAMFGAWRGDGIKPAPTRQMRRASKRLRVR